MSAIHQSLTINKIDFKNKIGMAAMCQYTSINGFSNDWHFAHYASRAVGGVGLIILEATAVSPEGRITPYDLGIWSDDHIAELKRISDFIQQQGSVAGIQIAHAGRKASHDSPANGGKQLSINEGGWQTVAPCSIPFDPSDNEPTELSVNDIQIVIDNFKKAAIRVRDAGFKVLEIHAAHGYLVHQFLSVLSNSRVDNYGGSFENRIRILLEITEAVKSVWPSDRALFVRLSCTDWVDGGWNLDETIMLCEILSTKGVDLIDCSSGGNIQHANIPLSPGYQVHFAEAIRKTGILTAAVGLITTEEQIIDILETEKADMVFLARELLRNPYFVLQTKGAEWPEQYLRAKREK